VARSRRRSPFTNPLVLFVFFLSAFFTAVQQFSAQKAPSATEVVANGEAYGDIGVAYVYDGDTIKLANGEKVRLIGIDTPESSQNKKLLRDAGRSGEDINKILAMGRRSAQYTRSLLEGRRVRLEFDIQKRDKYGRLLAYVYRVYDGLFINEDIIRSGYAYPMTIPPNIRHADEFKELFREAQKARRGLFKDNT
jgi:micrococcal nuclease